MSPQPCCSALAYFWRDFRFANPHQEAAFQARWVELSARRCFWWSLMGGVLVLICCVVVPFRSRIREALPTFLPVIAGLAGLLLATAAAVRFSAACRARAPHIATAVCLAAVGLCGWLLPLLIQLDALRTRDALTDVFQRLEGSPTAVAALQAYVMEVTIAQDLWPTMFYFHSYFYLLPSLAYTKCFAAAYFAMPLMLLLVSSLNPHVVNRPYQPIASSFLSACFATVATAYIGLLRRRQFQADYEWRQSMAKEAFATQKLARQETQYKESAEEADSILNHSLKNMMADAAGCIHMYAAGLSAPLPADLARALACLDQGMGWCRKRQALLRLAEGRYTPTLTAVRLPELGSSLVHGRSVACSFVETSALLDPLLCDLVLDNGINNAFRHGHPECPDVRFSIAVVGTTGDRQQLAFEVTNRAHPDRPAVTPELMAQVLAGQGERPVDAPALSEHCGLQHMFMAALAHDMSLTLQQEDGVVTLRGVLEVPTGPLTCREPPALAPLEATAALPPDTHIFCVDDSEIARLLLAHILAKVPGKPVVRTFGATAQEVEAFLAEAPQGADIVVLDQYLDYGAVHYQGTDLLQQLARAGFGGLACIRSANVCPDNQHIYLQAGAHCAIGKDVSPKVLVNTVLQAFARHAADREWSVPPTPGAVPPQLRAPPHDFTPVLMPQDILPGSVSTSSSTKEAPGHAHDVPKRR